jgi:hypothetical protein
MTPGMSITIHDLEILHKMYPDQYPNPALRKVQPKLATYPIHFTYEEEPFELPRWIKIPVYTITAIALFYFIPIPMLAFSAFIIAGAMAKP